MTTSGVGQMPPSSSENSMMNQQQTNGENGDWMPKGSSKPGLEELEKLFAGDGKDGSEGASGKEGVNCKEAQEVKDMILQAMLQNMMLGNGQSPLTQGAPGGENGGMYGFGGAAGGVPGMLGGNPGGSPMQFQ